MFASVKWPCAMPRAKVHGGAMVAIAVPVPRAAEPEGEAIALDVVFEDDHIIVIDKPAGPRGASRRRA